MRTSMMAANRRLASAYRPGTVVARAAASCAVAFCATVAAAELPARPNVVLILCDNLGYGDVGCYGARKHRTPRIDSLAGEGLRLTSFYSTSGVCTPSRSSLMTGCYPRRVNLHLSDLGGAVLQPVAAAGLHPNETTIAELLQSQGYATSLIGKWHLGDQPQFLPTRQGFDQYYGIPYSDDMTAREGKPWPPLPLMRNERVVEAPCNRDTLTKRYTEEAVAFIHQNRGRPFFLLLSHAMPGSTRAPYASAAFQGKSANGPWGDSVEEIDWSTGEVMQALEDAKLDRQTLVIWTSDNGAPLRNPPQGSNLPLGGWGYTTSEGGMRVPCIVRWTGQIRAGQTTDSVATMMDWLPTLTRLAGGRPPEVDGYDLSPLLQQPESPSPYTERGFFYYDRGNLHAVRAGPWKLRVAGPARGAAADDRQPPRLYNVDADPVEQRDLASERPETVAQLRKKLEWATAELGDGERAGAGQRPAGRAPNPQALSQRRGRRPNFVVILCDDLGYNDIGPFGATRLRTPQLDRLAAAGRRFTDFYVTSGVCTPSRASLLTGRYPRRVGLHENELRQSVLFPGNQTGLAPGELTIAELLAREGYATACVGKWHLGDQPRFLPTRQGFDRYFGIPYSNDMGQTAFPERNFPPLPLMRQEAAIETEPDQRYLTQRYTQEAIQFIREQRDRPFFLYLPHTMPHWPQFSSERFAGKSAGGPWGDAVEEIDWSTGEILQTIELLGLAANTLVVFLSDNGGAVRHGASNAPLRGGKASTWEGGHRVPCLAWWPGRVPAGTTCDEIATSLDLLPTLARLAGASAPLDREIDGQDIRPLLLDSPGAASPHQAVFYYAAGRLHAVRSGPWKLFVARRKSGKHVSLKPELYNLREDVGESRDVSAANPDVVARLMKLIEKARRDLGDDAAE